MNKQIEEMANDLAQHCPDLVQNCCGASSCVDCLTRFLYNAGYRKQEWISVEDRLPEQSGKYLVCTKNGNVYQTKFYSYPENIGGHWGQKDKGRSITHWMPLPEPPKGVNNG